jgi:hypothetical protein
MRSSQVQSIAILAGAKVWGLVELMALQWSSLVELFWIPGMTEAG